MIKVKRIVSLILSLSMVCGLCAVFAGCSYNVVVKNMRQQIEELQTQLSSQQEAINLQQETIDQQQDKIDELEKENEQLSNRIDELESQIYISVKNENLVDFASMYGEVMSVNGLSISVLCEGKNMTFQWTCCNGTIFSEPGSYSDFGGIGRKFTTTKEQRVKWVAYEFESETNSKCSEDYVSIIFRDEVNIVGYVVLHMYAADAYKLNHYAELVVSYEFPTINSQFQNIPETYVKRQISKYIVSAEINANN